MMRFLAILLLAAVSKADVGLVIGGFGASDTIQVVTPDGVCQGSAATPQLPRAPEGRFGWTSQYVDGKVVICGGAGVDIYSECFSLKIGDTKWMPVGQMEFRRRYPESVVFNGEMYIMGGYNTNQGWLNSIEKLNGGLMANWNMPRPIFDFCAVQMDDKRIMVLGGNVYGQFDSADVDILDTTTNTWSKGTPMAKPRATHDCMVAEYKGEKGVMVSGGCSKNCAYHLTDVSFYSFVTETWTELPVLNQGRMGHKMMSIGGKPAVIGGYLTGELNTIEVFDGDSWELQTQKLVYPTFHFGAPDQVPENITC